ncbi:MAG: hypothetical protein WC654_06580 [Patescibacteria group bacterium]
MTEKLSDLLQRQHSRLEDKKVTKTPLGVGEVGLMLKTRRISDSGIEPLRRPATPVGMERYIKLNAEKKAQDRFVSALKSVDKGKTETLRELENGRAVTAMLKAINVNPHILANPASYAVDNPEMFLGLKTEDSPLRTVLEEGFANKTGLAQTVHENLSKALSDGIVDKSTKEGKAHSRNIALVANFSQEYAEEHPVKTHVRNQKMVGRRLSTSSPAPPR